MTGACASGTGTPRPLVALDLDDTIVYWVEGAERLAEVAADPDLVVLERLEGRPKVSFTSRRTLELLGEVAAQADLVAITNRNVAQVDRLGLPVLSEGWVVHTGGTAISVDGRPEAGWDDLVRAAVARSGLDAATVTAWIAAAHPGVTRPAVWGDHTAYARVAEGAESAVAEVDAQVRPHGWRIHQHHHKAFGLPLQADKRAALTWLRTCLAPTAVAAAGDSGMDAGMMAAADLGIAPAHATGEARAAADQVTRDGGYLAAEQLLTSITNWLAGQPPTGDRACQQT